MVERTEWLPTGDARNLCQRPDTVALDARLLRRDLIPEKNVRFHFTRRIIIIFKSSPSSAPSRGIMTPETSLTHGIMTPEASMSQGHPDLHSSGYGSSSENLHKAAAMGHPLLHPHPAHPAMLYFPAFPPPPPLSPNRGNWLLRTKSDPSYGDLESSGRLVDSVVQTEPDSLEENTVVVDEEGRTHASSSTPSYTSRFTERVRTPPIAAGYGTVQGWRNSVLYN